MTRTARDSNATFNHGSIRVLDHGYVYLVDDWGSDETIIEAARMSTGKGFQGWEPKHLYQCPNCKYRLALPEKKEKGEGPICSQIIHHGSNGEPQVMIYHEAESHNGDERLLRYLWKNRHHTPFEMCGATFEVQAPIFVFRQWFTHRTQSRNEHSARYGPLPPYDYIPLPERCLAPAGANKQANGHRTLPGTLTMEEVQDWLASLEKLFAHCQTVYEHGMAIGIPSELARGATSVNRYSKMRVSANLRNWLHFLSLRCDEHAQWEIRQYANEIRRVLADTFPRTLALFMEGAK